MDTLEKKQQLRSIYKAQRQKFAESELKQSSNESFLHYLESFIQSKAIQSVLSFFPMLVEPPVNRLSQKIKKLNWAFPLIENQKLHFYKIPNFVETKDMVEAYSLKENKFSILEPNKDQHEKIDINQTEVCFVPGVAFDKKGGRLGLGKGFYDSHLNGYKGLKVGVAYSFQVMDEDLPLEPHDENLDFLITEKYILEPVKKVI